MRLLLSVAAVISLATVGPAFADAPSGYMQAKVRERLSEHLLDPESARYEFHLTKHEGTDTVVCGLVNSRNRFGGYAGRVPFRAAFMGKQLIYAGVFPEISPDIIFDRCR